MVKNIRNANLFSVSPGQGSELQVFEERPPFLAFSRKCVFTKTFKLLEKFLLFLIKNRILNVFLQDLKLIDQMIKF